MTSVELARELDQRTRDASAIEAFGLTPRFYISGIGYVNAVILEDGTRFNLHEENADG